VCGGLVLVCTVLLFLLLRGEGEGSIPVASCSCSSLLSSCSCQLRLQLPGASGSRRSASAHLHLPVSVPVSGSIHAVCCSFVLVSCVFPVFRFRVDVASAVFSISILSLDAAKDRPITDTDVQSDGRPLALPGNSHGALPLRDEVAAAGPTH